jgi:hypothetical protein
LASVQICKPSEDILRSFSENNRDAVSSVIKLLEDDNYREDHKIDLNLVEDGYRIWALAKDRVWIAFCEHSNNEVHIVHLSLISKFRVKWPEQSK